MGDGKHCVQGLIENDIGFGHVERGEGQTTPLRLLWRLYRPLSASHISGLPASVGSLVSSDVPSLLLRGRLQGGKGEERATEGVRERGTEEGRKGGREGEGG